MRLRMHIKEGVGRGLCGTCDHAHITIDNANQQTVRCHAIFDQYFNVPRPLVECNKHKLKTEMMLWEMQERVWIIEVKKGGQVGFIKPEHRNDVPR